MWCEGRRGKDAFGFKGARFELPLPVADALFRRRRLAPQQRCGYFRCEQRTVEHGCSQREPKIVCDDITAESRIGDIRRRRHRSVIFVLDVDCCCVLCGVRVEGGRMLFG